ncbi:MAG: amidohydrolase family protein [Planctomycetota bacterium]|nr:amidohydrolase family protein [Planctomycetota bacterium]MEE3367074.1 amidohydrolase family protein [Planctomycetota bacterium]
MSATGGPVNEVDHEFYRREIESFLPDRIYDAHTHLWCHDCVGWSVPGAPQDVGLEEYKRLMQDVHGPRPTNALFIPFTTSVELESRQQANQWVSDHTRVDPSNRGIFFIHPKDDPEWVRQEVRRLGLHGLKCYHTMSDVDPTWEADIEAFLPEPLIAVADQEGWVITLHMVKSRSVAEPANIACIRRYCETYPNMRLILAHSARGFQPAHNLEGLPQLTGLDNLYFDTSANCEPIAHQSIMRIIGHDKLMYGTDLPVSHFRGRSLSAADSFIWLYEETPVWGEKHQKIDPVIVGLEHIRSLKWACWSERLSDSQVEDVFYNNAARMLGV